MWSEWQCGAYVIGGLEPAGRVGRGAPGRTAISCGHNHPLLDELEMQLKVQLCPTVPIAVCLLLCVYYSVLITVCLLLCAYYSVLISVCLFLCAYFCVSLSLSLSLVC